MLVLFATRSLLSVTDMSFAMAAFCIWRWWSGGVCLCSATRRGFFCAGSWFSWVGGHLSGVYGFSVYGFGFGFRGLRQSGVSDWW